MTQKGAELLVNALAAAGVKQLFTLSGNQILSIYDATIGKPLRLLHTRHEAAAVHMADGWGRLRSAVAWHPYVEEDQEEEGQDAPLEGESRQASQHGPRLTRLRVHVSCRRPDR